MEPLLNVSIILVIAVKSFPAGKMEDLKVLCNHRTTLPMVPYIVLETVAILYCQTP